MVVKEIIIISYNNSKKRVFTEDYNIAMLKRAKMSAKEAKNTITLGGFYYHNDKTEQGYCFLQLTKSVIDFDTKEVLY